MLDIVWAGSFVPEQERNKRLAEYLDLASISPRIVRVSLWPTDRVEAFAGSRIRVLSRMMLLYPWLFVRLLMARRPDVYVVSYPGWFDVPIVKAVATLKRRPLVFDVFISLYDTAVTDRGLVSNRSVSARLAKQADRWSLRLSDRVIVDCRSHAEFLAELSGEPTAKFGVVYLGADEAVFRPAEPTPSGTLVLFYGSFVPLHGTEHIIAAAEHITASGVRIKMIGSGQTLGEVKRAAKARGLTNVEFAGHMTQQELVGEIEAAALCLGIFGQTPKADRVVPHKLYEALASGRPVITADTTAIREVFPDGAVRAIPRDAPEDLAREIESLLADTESLRELAEAGRRRFVVDFAGGPQSERLLEELEEVTGD